MTAQYKLLQPHYIQNAYLDQGTIVTEGVQIPVGWVPTLQVDPLNVPAVNAFYAAGPRGQCWEDMNEFGQQNYLVGPIKPVTYWVQKANTLAGGFGAGFSSGFRSVLPVGVLYWQLTGLGVNLQPLPVV